MLHFLWFPVEQCNTKYRLQLLKLKSFGLTRSKTGISRKLKDAITLKPLLMLFVKSY